jgi:hypothetical protein
MKKQYNQNEDKTSDYYINEDGLQVFTKEFLLKRGYCCLSACSHCPYEDSKNINPDIPFEFQTKKSSKNSLSILTDKELRDLEKYK